MKTVQQSGSHVIAIAVGLLALSVVAFTGYTVLLRNRSAPATRANGTRLTSQAAITTKADLDRTARSLDTASADIDSSVDASSLDSSLNDLL